MKTYELLANYDNYVKSHPEEFCGTTESMTIFLVNLGYGKDKIAELLSNPITRECVEINQRSYSILNNKKINFSKK